MKEKARNGILILFGVGVLVYLFATAMIALTDRQNVHTVTIHEACGVLELEHSINGLIPIGTDYYYLGVDDETGYGYLIKGSKKWLEKNFDENYQSLQPGGVQIKGLVKTITEYKLERELTDRLSQLDGLQYPYGVLLHGSELRSDCSLEAGGCVSPAFCFSGFQICCKGKRQYTAMVYQSMACHIDRFCDVIDRDYSLNLSTV